MQLVVDSFGASLRKQGELFVVAAGTNQLKVSARKVQSIVLTTAAHLTTDALELAVAHNIDVLLLGELGRPVGRFRQCRMGSTAAIRRRQLELAETPEGLELSKEWVGAKLRNQLEFLEELHSRRPQTADDFAPALAAVRAASANVAALAGTPDERRMNLMGLEGGAGRSYFALVGMIVPEVWRFSARSRRPATDGFNATLNYAYGVLYGLVERACVLAGLDPHLGFLHTDDYGKPSLVYDLIEPFRILGDRAVLLLFTGRRVERGWFAEVPGGVALSKEGRAAFLTSFNERLDKRVRYPVRSNPKKYRNTRKRDVIGFKAHALANRLLGKDDLPRIVEYAEAVRGGPGRGAGGGRGDRRGRGKIAAREDEGGE